MSGTTSAATCDTVNDFPNAGGDKVIYFPVATTADDKNYDTNYNNWP